MCETRADNRTNACQKCAHNDPDGARHLLTACQKCANDVAAACPKCANYVAPAWQNLPKYARIIWNCPKYLPAICQIVSKRVKNLTAACPQLLNMCRACATSRPKGGQICASIVANYAKHVHKELPNMSQHFAILCQHRAKMCKSALN